MFERELTGPEWAAFTHDVDRRCWDDTLGWWVAEAMVELLQETTGVRTILVEEHIAY